MLVLMTLNLLACREDPGAPEYPDPAQSPGDTGSTDDDFLSGSEPYVEGEARLSVGLFYEGGYSDLLEVDDQTHENLWRQLLRWMAATSVPRLTVAVSPATSTSLQDDESVTPRRPVGSRESPR